jgi:hypothetical protein
LTAAERTDRVAHDVTGKRTKQHLETLATRVRGLDAVFSCGGTVTLPAPVRLRFEGRRAVPVVGDRYGDDTRVARRLRKECAPARFGLGSETRRDPRVRDGGQLLADGGALSVEGLDLVETGILEKVRSALCPGAAELPDAELHALNVYTRRGHFVRHKDTPRDRACFGTLVACLPIHFDGGRLVLRQESTRVYDWEPRRHWLAGADERPYEVQWAAFYGDVDHEIEPVWDGTRVTLTWLLRSAEDAPVAPPPPAASEADLEAAIRDALADRRFLPRGGTLGVPCLHLYAETPGFVRPANAMSKSAVSRLKGRDRRVAFAAQRAGLRVRYRPYLYEDCAFEAWRLSREPTEREARIFGQRRLDGFTLTETLPIEHEISAWNAEDDVTWIVPAAFGDRDERAGADDAVPASELLGDLEYSATDYFGNEGGDTAFYVSAALLFEVPPARERAARGATR